MEDYWAIWVGLAILGMGMIIFWPKGDEAVEAKIAKANVILQAEAKKAPFKTVA